jgi:hypothetical protein
MKHLKKYNESIEKTFKNDDSDIKLFFTDYTDEDSNALTIKNGLVHDGRFITDTPYMKDISKFRRAKLITLNVGKLDGLSIGIDSCITDIDRLSDVLADIKRFYELSGEEVNYTINTSHMGLVIKFITIGDEIKEDESKSSKIDGYLKRVGECIKKKGHKRQSIKGNWLEMRFAKRGDYDFAISSKLRKIGDGSVNLDNTTNEIDIETINIRNEAWEDGLKFNISGGDQQVILKLIKR